MVLLRHFQAAVVLLLVAAARGGSAQAEAVSYHPTTGMILSTGNIYFTSRQASGADRRAYVWRTGQYSQPGQEIPLYAQDKTTFSDIVFANVGGVWFGYFFSQKDSPEPDESPVTILRVPLAGGNILDLKPKIFNLDITKVRRNLATDGDSLFWQERDGIKKMPIVGGNIATIETTVPHMDPTAGILLRGNSVIYAYNNDIRRVRKIGDITDPLIRTIARASAPVTALHATTSRVYWGQRTGEVLYKALNFNPVTVGSAPGVPGSIATNSVNGVGWTQCQDTPSCDVRYASPPGALSSAVGALGASFNGAGRFFWGSSRGIQRRSLF